jgi:glycosyltransferase involved in cell wall biosynthesis
VFILRLARQAKRAGYEVDVLTTEPRLQQALRASGLGIVDLDVIWREIRPWRDLRGGVRLSRFLRDAGYDIVHTHTTKGGLVGRWAARRARVPVIVHTVHGFAFHEESSRLHSWFYASLERLAARWCDRIVTVSEFHRDWARRLRIGRGEQVVAIPNGVRAEDATACGDPMVTRRSLGLRDDEFVVLSPVRLAEQKGLVYLLEAARRVEERSQRRYRFLLAGDGPLRSALMARAAELGVESQVTFLGHRDDMGELLAACDMVALPSLWEGLSLALLEAMLAGKPIVTTTLGSNREVSRHGDVAVLVPPKDPVGLADAIVRLAEDPEARRRLSATARRVAEDHYAEDELLGQYVDLYGRLTGGTSEHGRVRDEAGSWWQAMPGRLAGVSSHQRRT